MRNQKSIIITTIDVSKTEMDHAIKLLKIENTQVNQYLQENNKRYIKQLFKDLEIFLNLNDIQLNVVNTLILKEI